MDAHIEEDMINDCIKKIQALAVLALYGGNVDSNIESVIYEACYLLFISKKCDVTVNLWELKSQITKMANVAHYSLPDYKKSLEYAASLVAIHQL